MHRQVHADAGTRIGRAGCFWCFAIRTEDAPSAQVEVVLQQSQDHVVAQTAAGALGFGWWVATGLSTGASHMPGPVSDPNGAIGWQHDCKEAGIGSCVLAGYSGDAAGGSAGCSRTCAPDAALQWRAQPQVSWSHAAWHTQVAHAFACAMVPCEGSARK